MNYTSNYNLRKPSNNDFYDIADPNANMDIIDEALDDLQTQIYNNVIGLEDPSDPPTEGNLITLFDGNYVADTGKTAELIREIRFTTTEPTVGSASSYPNGTIIAVYE